jgi:hypothetical protein
MAFRSSWLMAIAAHGRRAPQWRWLRTTRHRDHPFRRIVITRFTHRDHLFRAS